jgi:hypothetical protein
MAISNALLNVEEGEVDIGERLRGIKKRLKGCLHRYVVYPSLHPWVI